MATKDNMNRHHASGPRHAAGGPSRAHMFAPKAWRKHLPSLVVYFVLIGGAIGSVVGFSAGSAIRAVVASLTLGRVDLGGSDLDQNEGSHKLRRRLQKHYLSYELYIPLDDFVVVNEQDLSQTRLTFLMRNGCGDAKLYIWVPLKIRLPFYGTRVWEWCWKPPLKNQPVTQRAENEPGPNGHAPNSIPQRPKEFTKQLNPPPSSTNSSRKS